jgi:hypothetical protein
MSSRKAKSFRTFVPVLLNGRLIQYYFSAGEPNVRLEINVRQYTRSNKLGWVPKRIIIQFEKRMITHHPDQSVTVFGEKPEPVVETFYTCDNDSIRFEQEHIPFVT